jgi:murein DD-endopeptidase MepM/ murein hydrolase activator NlpD
MKYNKENGENIKRRISDQTGVQFETKHPGLGTARIALAVALILVFSTMGIFAEKQFKISQFVLQALNVTESEEMQEDEPQTINGFRISYPFEVNTNPYSVAPYAHSGIDIEAPKGTPVLAAADGTVRVSEYNHGGGYGYYVIIDHEDGFSTLYAHLEMQDTPLVEPGQEVEAGEKIGTVGVTGYSTGPHLHFELRNRNDDPVDPAEYWAE